MRRNIVTELAQARRVEDIVGRICRPCPDASALSDLSQMVYIVLLTYDAEKVVDLWERGQLDFFIVRVVLNQFRSRNSPFYHALREFSRRGTEEVTERNGGQEGDA